METIRELMELVPPPDVRGKTVLLKPNILSPKKPEAAVCTHPTVIAASVRVFLERGAARVMVGESPATANPTAAAKATGIYHAVLAAGGEWVEFHDWISVACPEGKLVKSVEFASVFSEADLVVSLAKLKTHQLMAYTGVMKNLFGLVVGLQKAQMHFRFSDKKDFAVYLTDLNLAANAQYAIMDAIVGMEGNGGPGNGNPISLGFLAASDNLLALDWECASIIGYQPQHILNLNDALDRKVWLLSPEEIVRLGDDPQELKPASFQIVKEPSAYVSLRKMLPDWLYRMTELILIKTPRFQRKKCILCGRCIEICPSKALRLEERKIRSGRKKKRVVLEKVKCLHCFCCHEICPVEAILLKRFSFFR